MPTVPHSNQASSIRSSSHENHKQETLSRIARNWVDILENTWSHITKRHPKNFQPTEKEAVVLRLFMERKESWLFNPPSIKDLKMALQKDSGILRDAGWNDLADIVFNPAKKSSLHTQLLLSNTASSGVPLPQSSPNLHQNSKDYWNILLTAYTNAMEYTDAKQFLITKLGEIITEEVSSSGQTKTNLEVAQEIKNTISNKNVVSYAEGFLRKETTLFLDGIINKEKEEVSLFQELKQHKEFKNFKETETWRFFIDGNQAHRGQYAFDNEFGYMAGMFKTFKYVLQTRNEKVTTAYFITLHDMAIDDVRSTSGQFFSKNFRLPGKMGYFELHLGDTATHQGIEEFIRFPNNARYSVKWSFPEGESRSEKPRKDSQGNFLTEAGGRIGLFFSHVASHEEEFIEYSDRVIKEYHHGIKIAQNGDEQLIVIAELCRNLERAHLFIDGNGRAIGMLLLNKVLLENGLSPALLADPNIFDLNTLEEIVSEIKKGQVRFNDFNSMPINGKILRFIQENKDLSSEKFKEKTDKNAGLTAEDKKFLDRYSADKKQLEVLKEKYKPYLSSGIAEVNENKEVNKPTGHADENSAALLEQSPPHKNTTILKQTHHNAGSPSEPLAHNISSENSVKTNSKTHYKNSAISGGMMALGIGGSVNAFKHGDMINGSLGATESGLGVFSLANEAAATSTAVAKTLPKVANTAKHISKAIPYAGAAFSAASAVQTGIELKNSITSGDTKGIVKNSVGVALDSAMVVTDLIPVIGTPITIGLVTARLTSDMLIDQAWDPDAYKKTFELLKAPDATWFDKGVTATTGGLQAAWSWTPLGNIFHAKARVNHLKELAAKQNTELHSHEFSPENAKKFMRILDVQEEDTRIIDFTDGSLSHYAGNLEMRIISPTKAYVHVGGTGNPIEPQAIGLGEKPVSTLFIKMGQGVNYYYLSEMKEEKYYFIRIAEERIAISAIAWGNSLASTYYGPQDGTNLVFVAPNHPPILPKNSALPIATFKEEDFYYTLHGGTGKNTYLLGKQNATIHMGLGINRVEMSWAEDTPRTLSLYGYRDDETCSLKFGKVTADSDLFKNAQLGVRKLSQSSDLEIKLGKTTINLPSMDIKKFYIIMDKETVTIHIDRFMDECIFDDTGLFQRRNLKDYTEPVNVLETSISHQNDIFSNSTLKEQKNDLEVSASSAGSPAANDNFNVNQTESVSSIDLILDHENNMESYDLGNFIHYAMDI